jgi:hypothetical protein
MRKLSQKVGIDFTDERLVANGGALFVSQMSQRLQLPKALREAVSVKVRDRGASDEEMLLSLIYSLAQGDGYLSDLDRFRADEARVLLSGIEQVPGSRRLGEYLSRFTLDAVDGLRGVGVALSRQVMPQVIEQAREELGYVPVFVDGSAIEVMGQYEGAAAGYNEEKQYWLHSVFVGRLWASQRLWGGGVDVAQGWREQLNEVQGQLVGQPVWMRADNAYYRGEVVQYCQEHGWDYTISVTHPNYKRPLVRQLSDIDEDSWEWLNEQKTEQAAWLVHKPSGWKEVQSYVVIRTLWDEGQKLLVPRHTFILASRADLPLSEVIRRHRGKQGQENAQKGPLIDLDLHHPPCRSWFANQAFYAAGQIAQILLLAIQHKLLPKTARQHGLRVLIRDLIRVPARLVSRARRLVLKFTKSAHRLDWIVHAAEQMEYMTST